MVVSLEDELIPLVRLSPVFHEVSQTHLYRHFEAEQRFVQVGDPVLPAEVQEDVRRRQEHMVLDRTDGRKNSTVPEFPDVTLIAGRHVALQLLLRDQLSQEATSAHEFL